MATKTINLRDVPEDLVRRAKAYAALRGLSLKELIIQAIEKALNQAGQDLASTAFFVSLQKKKPKRRAGYKPQRK